MAYTPKRVRFIVTRFASRCFWCGSYVATETSAAFYPDERQTAHERCHREACA